MKMRHVGQSGVNELKGCHHRPKNTDPRFRGKTLVVAFVVIVILHVFH